MLLISASWRIQPLTAVVSSQPEENRRWSIWHNNYGVSGEQHSIIVRGLNVKITVTHCVWVAPLQLLSWVSIMHLKRTHLPMHHTAGSSTGLWPINALEWCSLCERKNIWKNEIEEWSRFGKNAQERSPLFLGCADLYKAAKSFTCRICGLARFSQFIDVRVSITCSNQWAGID